MCFSTAHLNTVSYTDECIELSAPLKGVSMDFTLLEHSLDGYENGVVLTDMLTRFCVGIPTYDETAQTVAAV